MIFYFFFFFWYRLSKEIRALSLKEQKKIPLLCYILFSNNTIPPLISPNLSDLINFKSDLMFSKVDFFFRFTLLITELDVPILSYLKSEQSRGLLYSL